MGIGGLHRRCDMPASHLGHYQGDEAGSMKALFILVAITANGEYIERSNLTVHQCIGFLVKSREAAAVVAMKYPKIKVEYECRAI